GAADGAQRRGQGLAVLLATELVARAEADHRHALAGALDIQEDLHVAELAAQVAALDHPGDASADALVELGGGAAQRALVEDPDDGAFGALAGGTAAGNKKFH